jgi:hypothetical protein
MFAEVVALAAGVMVVLLNKPFARLIMRSQRGKPRLIQDEVLATIMEAYDQTLVTQGGVLA